MGANQTEIDAVRGVGDEFALRFRHHNPQLHARYSPEGSLPKRCSSGSNRPHRLHWCHAHEGCGAKSGRTSKVQCKQAAFDTITAESDAPLSVAVGLLVRQQLTGREPPSAEHVVQYWREHVLENAGEHIESLRDHVTDQDAFANLCRNIIADLGLPIDLTDPNEGDTNPEDMDSMDQSEEADSI